MESTESPDDPAGLRDRRHAAQELPTRGRKRASAALTTANGVPEARDRSKSLVVEFKRRRAQPPAEGGVFRDRSNDRDLNFKRPHALPKHRRRHKRVVAKGNTPPPAAASASVSAGETATPTPTSAPPTPFHSPQAPPPGPLGKAWADYDEEDDRRVYEEDPSTLFTDSPSPAPPLTPLPSPPPPLSPPLTRSSLSSEEQVKRPLLLSSPVEEELPEQRVEIISLRMKLNDRKLELARRVRDLVSLIRKLEAQERRYSGLILKSLNRELSPRERKEKVVELLHREDAQSGEQKRDGQTHFEDLFRDIEKMKTWSGFFYEQNTDSSLFSKELDVKVTRFLFLGDQRELREETERLCRYKKLLMEWNAAFRREEHDVSAWVGDLLEEMLDEIREDISYVIRLGKMTPQCLPSKHGSGLSLSAFRKLKKRMLEMIKLHITGLRQLDTNQPNLFLLSFKDSHTSAVLSTLGTFYQSSGSRRRRSVEERNTRKWLRHVHTRRAAVTQGRSRRRLTAIGHKLCSHFSHRSGLTLEPGGTVPHNSA